MIKPNFFIVGGAKCGTTALSEYLRDHKFIYFSSPKEPHHFSSDLNTPGKVTMDDGEYIDTFFADANASYSAVGEASVFYLYSKVAIENIIRYNPDAKLIAIFRHPVDAAYSLHQQFYFAGWEDQRSFYDAWKLQEDRSNGVNRPENLPIDPEFLQYRSIYQFGEQVERLLLHVRSDQFLPLLYDDFKRDTRSVYSEVLNFLGVEDDQRMQFERINASRRISWPLIADILRSRLASRCAHAIKRITGARSLRIGRPQAALAKGLRKELGAEFNHDIRKLESLIGRDLSHWA